MQSIASPIIRNYSSCKKLRNCRRPAAATNCRGTAAIAPPRRTTQDIPQMWETRFFGSVVWPYTFAPSPPRLSQHEPEGPIVLRTHKRQFGIAYLRFFPLCLFHFPCPFHQIPFILPGWTRGFQPPLPASAHAVSYRKGTPNISSTQNLRGAVCPTPPACFEVLPFQTCICEIFLKITSYPADQTLLSNFVAQIVDSLDDHHSGIICAVFSEAQDDTIQEKIERNMVNFQS